MAKRRPPPKIFKDVPDFVDVSRLEYDDRNIPFRPKNKADKKLNFEREYYSVPKNLRLYDIERKKKNLEKLEREIAYLEYLEKESQNNEIAEKEKEKKLNKEHLKKLIAIAEYDDMPPKLEEASEKK